MQPRLELLFDTERRGDLGGYEHAVSGTESIPAATNRNGHYRFQFGEETEVTVGPLPDFPFTSSDPLVVTRSNPVDARGVGE